MVSAAAVADQSAVIIIETVAAGGAVQSVWWHTETWRAAREIHNSYTTSSHRSETHRLIPGIPRAPLSTAAAAVAPLLPTERDQRPIFGDPHRRPHSRAPPTPIRARRFLVEPLRHPTTRPTTDRSLQAQAQAQGGGGPAADAPVVDTAELVYISSMALFKMLKHGRAGVPMEVMGLMLGDFVDDYTVKCVDVFAMPQSGTGVSVEAVDPVFQQQMLDMLKQTGRPEMVVGWYHSHPGFGCWLSGVDINTQQSFEALNQRAVAVVVDPIQSVKGKVVIDCFRTINPQMIMLGQEPRQTTSNLGHLTKPSIQALIHGLNRHYYGISLSYRKNELEMQMLENLHKKTYRPRRRRTRRRARPRR